MPMLPSSAELIQTAAMRMLMWLLLCELICTCLTASIAHQWLFFDRRCCASLLIAPTSTIADVTIAGILYLQAERPGGGLVAIKALSLRSMQGDWQQLELFEKEANALHSMNHPGIPAYKDYFEVDNDGDRAYFLVQVCFAQVCMTWFSSTAPHCCGVMPTVSSRGYDLCKLRLLQSVLPCCISQICCCKYKMAC